MAQGLFNLKQVMQAVQQSGWIAQKPSTVEYLLVAGGGGGGRSNGGAGGGAGGLLQGTAPVVNGSAILVTVGGGGSGGTSASGTGQGISGSNSVFGTVVAQGGGGGGGADVSTAPLYNFGLTGGSGGGTGTNGSGYVNGIGGGTFGQGNAGGRGSSDATSWRHGGGGGGAGAIGLNVITGTSGGLGDGGSGISSVITGTVTAYAGGGGGGAFTGVSSVGGVGGGGAGGNSSGPSATAGTTNRGGGGGGGGAAAGAAGGSGIVVISYPDVYAAATSTTGSPTVSTSGSGSLAFNGSTQFLNYAAQTPFVFGTGDFTIEFWAYPTGGLGVFPAYVDFRGSSVASPVPVIYNNNGTLTYYVAGADRITATYSTLNAWVHIAVCRIGTATKMYVNGTQVGSTYTDTNNYTVGTGGPYIAQNGAGGGYFTGYMSNIRFVKGVGVYTGTFTPSTTPLTTTQTAGTNISAITGTQTSLLLNTVSGAYTADSSTNSYAPTTSTSVVPAWNQLSPFTGTGYKNRVYTWTSSGSITF
jgi:hypothetical protein